MRLIHWITVIAGVLLVSLLGVMVISDLGEEPDVPDEDVVPDDPAAEIVAEDLDIPWEIVFLPDGEMLVTERPGTLRWIGEDDTYAVEGVEHVGEGGLLGMALHPEFEQNQQIYLYMTTEVEEGLTNRVVRYTMEEGHLTDPQTIIDGIPGAQYHDGGRIAFGPDGYLYITTGDANQPQLAQDLDSLAGKILRVEPDGSIPADNPFNDEIYTYGHRNPQGLAWDDAGNLWSTEHGDIGKDMLNLIEPGTNYGWPVIEGAETMEGMQEPVIQSGDDTWAPAGMAYVDGHIVFAGLRGSSLYVADIEGEQVVSFDQRYEDTFGRLRAVTVGPDGGLYVSTSNTDGRGTPDAADDRIYRIDSEDLVA